MGNQRDEIETEWHVEELSPIRDKVYEYIKQAILSGKLKAGERIVERELADTLKISRTPIREALFRLESQGFVKTMPRRGVVVSHLSTEQVLEVYTILSVLNALAVKLAAQKIDDEQRQKLLEIVGQIDDVLDGNLGERDIEQFHLEIVDTITHAAKSPKLHEMIKGLFEYIRAFASSGLKQPQRMRQNLEEHRAIAIAICDGEPDLAENLAKVHIENSKKFYLETLKNK